MRKYVSLVQAGWSGLSVDASAVGCDSDKFAYVMSDCPPQSCSAANHFAGGCRGHSSILTVLRFDWVTITIIVVYVYVYV